MIVWSERTVLVSQLKPFEKNPRRISKTAFEALKQSIKDVGYHQRILATPDLRVIGGHQRIKIMQEFKIKTVPVLVPDRELTDAEFKRIIVQDNLPFGEFAFEKLALDYRAEDLIMWGMPDTMIGFINPAQKVEDEWVGMPSFDQPDKMPFRTLHVHFDNQADVDAFAKLVKQQITDKTKFLWYPEAEKARVAHLRVKAIDHASSDET